MWFNLTDIHRLKIYIYSLKYGKHNRYKAWYLVIWILRISVRKSQ